MVKFDQIEGIFRNLDRSLANLALLAQAPRAELLEDIARLGAAKYYLQVSVECCLDAANHIIARQNWRSPTSYTDSFAVLAEHSVIPTEFLTTTRQMVGMRNRLVHLYWEVDADAVYDTLQNNLGGFRRFEAYIYAYLQQPGVSDLAFCMPGLEIIRLCDYGFDV